VPGIADLEIVDAAFTPRTAAIPATAKDPHVVDADAVFAALC
jgi:hypothetical protein